MKAINRFRWVILAFIISGLLISGLLIWQLYETAPTRWCALAVNSADTPQGCFDVLLKLLEIKDHAVIGLLLILGVTVLAVVAVTLQVRMDVDGPGGLSVDIGPQTTTISDDAGTSQVEVPTPPSETLR